METYKCQNRTPPYHVLLLESCLLHYIFVRIFYPQDNSKEVYNEVSLEAIYQLMNGYSVDYALIIVNYMYGMANMSRPPLSHMEISSPASSPTSKSLWIPKTVSPKQS